ncbi:hypothetical protein D3C77_286200 [compost metagenome]
MLQRSQLFLRASDDFRVAVTTSNDGYSCEKVRVASVIVVIQVLHLSFDDLRRSSVEMTRARVKIPLPLLKYVI